MCFLLLEGLFLALLWEGPESLLELKKTFAGIFRLHHTQYVSHIVQCCEIALYVFFFPVVKCYRKDLPALGLVLGRYLSVFCPVIL